MWGSPAGRFVAVHGVIQTAISAALMLGICGFAVHAKAGLAAHVATVVGGSVVTGAIGYVALRPASRRRLQTLVRAARATAVPGAERG
jgi:hypothetical protein